MLSVDIIRELLACRPVDRHGNDLVSVREYKQVSIIPDHTCVIYTINVCESKSNGDVMVNKRHAYGTSEDNSYKCHAILHRAIPRCYSVLKIVSNTDGQVKFWKRMHGMYKFSSSNSNDEDDDITCELIDPELMKTSDTIVVTEKANGKTAIITTFEFQNQTYVFGGSKGKHRIVRLHHIVEDITLMETQDKQHNNLLIDIFTLFDQQFQSLISDNQTQLLSNLSTRSLCGEYNDYKHLVSNQHGQLKPNIKWFGISENLGMISPTQSLNGDFLQNINYLQTIGLPTITLQTYTPDQFKTIYPQLKLGTDVEGWVVHWIITQPNGQRVTIGVEKLKTWWYIILRMLREIIRGSAKGGGLANIYEIRIKKTILKRNQDFMKLPEGCLFLWSELCCAFCRWFVNKGYNFNVIDFQENSKGMGNTWQEFLKDCPQVTDRFDLPEVEVQKRGLENYQFKVEFHEIPRLVVFFKGIPGLGKSTIGHLLSSQLNHAGYQTLTLEQDDFKGKTAGKQCFLKFQDYLKKTQNRIILVQRNNANLSQYQGYLDTARDQGCRILIINPAEINLKSLLLVCIESVLNRKDHKTFTELKPELRAKLVLTYAVEFQDDYAPTDKNNTSVHNLKWLNVSNDNHINNSMCQYLDSYLNEIRQSKNVYDNKLTRPMHEVNQNLQLTSTPKYYQWRRDTNELATELFGVIQDLVK